ncbi:alkaline phosphatase D family protein [Pendulispora rubella]|uniref:Alkaline phosphatase D family protein n=1 Tax=Pendulispora rubella TaxID=2741070 RepID=A0ABZ2KTI1_9BACT
MKTSLRVLSRRDILMAGGACALAACSPKRPASGAPLELSHGVQCGDVTASSALVWARAGGLARMRIETSLDESMKAARTWNGPVLAAETDFTGKYILSDLPADSVIHYRVTMVDPSNDSSWGPPVVGRFQTAPAQAKDIRFVWSGDLAGQGYGINPAYGGYRIFKTMEALNPLFFLCSGDSIYADGEIPETIALPNGTEWRNIVSEEKSKVAETLDEFRGNYKYNLLDTHFRSFASKIAQVIQWDDHEVRNNWYPGQILDDARYTEKRITVLAERAKRAFLEYMPIAPNPNEARRVYRTMHYGPLLDLFVLDMRTYRNANDENRAPPPSEGILGVEQVQWLKRELEASRATWKVIASDMPIGLVVRDGNTRFEAVAQGDGGPPLGREGEIAEILSFVHQKKIPGLVWLTADVHYTAAHYYNPDKAAFSDFTPFWEFVSGPLNAGGFGPNDLDATFGPEVKFVKAPSRQSASPLETSPYFGEVFIEAYSKVMTVTLRDTDGAALYSVRLDPATS